jgi:hypothetical protein
MQFGISRFVTCLLLGVSISGAASAEVFTCLADPSKRLSIDSGGSVLVDIDGAGIINICSLSNGDRGVTKEACAGWYSTLLTYRFQKAKARLYFNQGYYGMADVTSCPALGNWNARTPYYIEPG